MPNFKIRVYEDDDVVGSIDVHDPDEAMSLNQIIEDIQNREMRKSLRAHRMKEWSREHPITLKEYVRYCFVPHLRPVPPPKQTLKEPIPFSVYVDQWSV